MYTIKNHPNLSFRLINRLTGWGTFIIASMTYILTAEPTASLWDCGEFITTSVGLQVGHPPGAPLVYDYIPALCYFRPLTGKAVIDDQLHVCSMLGLHNPVFILVHHPSGT